MANPNNFPNIEGSELVSQSWTKLLERDASVKKQFAANEFPEVTAEDVGTPCYREDEQKWYIFTGMGELDTPIWWCPFDEIAAESVAFEPTEEFPASADTVAEALDFLSKKELPNAIIMPAESSEFVGDNVRVEFPLQKVTSNKNTVHVFFSGVKQSPSSYNLGEGGESVIFNEPPAYGEIILIQENATILEYDLMPLEASFVADNETTFKMPIDIVDVRVVQVNVAGTVLQHNQYSVNGRDIILNEPVTGNVQITTIYKGQLSSPAPNTVNTVALQAGAVTGEKLADSAITENKLADANIGTTKIANSAITESKLANGAVTSNKIAEGSINLEHLADLVEQKLLGVDRVASEMLQENSVNMAKLGTDVKARLDEISAGVTSATETMQGVVKLASAEEILANTGGDKVVTSDAFNGAMDKIEKLGGGRNIGDIFYTSRMDKELNGAVECDGATYNVNDYSGQITVGGLLSSEKLPYVSLDEYEEIYTANGSCRCFGWDGRDIFRVPTLSEVYIEAGLAVGAGEFINEALPSPKIDVIYRVDSSSSGVHVDEFGNDGYSLAVATSSGTDEYMQSSSAKGKAAPFAAILNDDTYEDNAKVKPDSVKYRAMVQLYTGAKEISITDYTNRIEEVTINVKEDVTNTVETAISDLDNAVASGKSEIEDAIQEGLADIDTALGGGGGLEIGDIGFAPLGIDETQNKRRYLNGQIISQSQFESFTNWVKERANLYPNTIATEENWQAEVTNSKLGQCGKFVIDDELGTIRLPKVVNINGLQDLALMGGIKAESLPNITGGAVAEATWQNLGGINSFYGCVEPTDNQGGYPQNGGKNGTSSSGWSLNASRSSSAYQDEAPVQQEAIQYPYFIQVATGTEESVDVTREIELNNPFSLLDYKWSEYEISNASWLLSNGQFNSGATYISVYNLLLEIYNGTVTKDGVSVKLSTEEYTDTDFVINTADTTFRLPIRTASDYVVESKEATAEDSSWYRVYKSGWVEQGGTLTTSSASFQTFNLNKEFISSNYTITGNVCHETQASYAITFRTKTETTFEAKCTQSNMVFNWQACGQGAEILQSKIYFYVGETIQDANVIAASQVLTTIADCVRKSSATDRETVVGWGMPDYDRAISITANTAFVAPFNGFIEVAGEYGSNGGFTVCLGNIADRTKQILRGAQSGTSAVYSGGQAVIVKGQTYYFEAAMTINRAIICPCKGVN